MIFPGLVSVTFRHLSPAEIIALARETGLRGIMWGGDVHAKAGQLPANREIGRMTLDAGLEIESYGSYYRAGSERAGQSFESELEIALALGAPRMRVWAGTKESHLADARDRAAVVEDLRHCDELARKAGIEIAIEFHSHTLTDTAESAATLMRDLSGAAAVRLSWQPPNGMPKADALAGLRLVLPWVDAIHVFHWRVRGEEQIRLPLAEGAGVWPDYLRALEETGRDRWAMLEFVRDDDPAQLRADAEELRRWLVAAGSA